MLRCRQVESVHDHSAVLTVAQIDKAKAKGALKEIGIAKVSILLRHEKRVHVLTV